MKKLAIIILWCAMLIEGCSRQSNGIMHGDLLNINGITYVCYNISVPDKSVTGRVISKVRNKISGSHIASGYRLKDGDSINLKNGTRVYELEGIDVEDMVSVNWENREYLIYINENRAEEILSELRNDIDKAVGARIESIVPGNKRSAKYIYDFELLNSIKEELINAEEYTGEFDDLSKFYSIEFLIPYADNKYKPCLRFIYRTGDGVDFGVLYDNGIRLIGPALKNIIVK